MFAGSGIRTHEAEARDLETRPFDRSGIPAEFRLTVSEVPPSRGRLTLPRLEARVATARESNPYRKIESLKFRRIAVSQSEVGLRHFGYRERPRHVIFFYWETRAARYRLRISDSSSVTLPRDQVVGGSGGGLVSRIY